MTFDVVVVGSGACGSLAARELTRRGLRVCVVEAGPAEPDPNAALTQPVQSRSLAFAPPLHHFYVDDALNPYTSAPDSDFVWIRSRQLGGRTRTWAAHTMRLSRDEWSTPELESGAHWPFPYDEIVPDYEEAERASRVIGAADATFSPRVDDAWAARPLTNEEARIKAAIEARWPERPVSLAPYTSINGSVDEDRRHALRYVEFFKGDLSRQPFFASSSRTTLADAQATGLLTLRTDAIVRAVETEGDRATGVRVIDRTTRAEDVIRGKSVMLCASTLESTRLLLVSGLGASSGTLGRYLSDHLWGIGVIAYRPGAIDPPLAWPSLVVPPFRTAQGTSRYQFACAIFGEPERTMMRVRVCGEPRSMADNRVTLDESRVDAWGIPTLRIACRRAPEDLAQCEEMAAGAVELAEACGYTVAEQTSLEPPGVSIHEVGTARMGKDPHTSVVDPTCRVWEMQNLYVADGAVMPRVTARPPTLTMMALAVRASRALADSLR